MEMLIGGCTAMLIGFLAGRAMKLKDADVVTVIAICGGASCLTGLALLWIANITVGQSASPLWIVSGAIGGVIGVVFYKATTFLPWLVDFLKKL